MTRHRVLGKPLHVMGLQNTIQLMMNHRLVHLQAMTASRVIVAASQ